MSIKLKFILLISIFIIIIVGILTLISIKLQKEHLLKSNDERIKVIMLNSSETIKSGMITADDLLISSTVKKIKGKNPDIINAYLLNNQGYLLFHSDIEVMSRLLGLGKKKVYKDKSIQKALSSIKFLKQKLRKGTFTYYLYSFPISDNNIRIATLFVEFSPERINKLINKLKIRLIIISLIILSTIIVVTLLFTAKLTEPIIKLSDGAKIIGKGNLDYKIDIKRKDEIGLLANSFNKMTEELKISRQKIIEKELMEQDLEIASEIQRFFLPDKIEEIEKISIGTYYAPAKFIGGDFYDIVKIDKNRWGIIIVDVSGHGSSAAIVMSVISFIFHTIVTKVRNCAELMYILNNGLFERLQGEKYATGIFLIYDAKKGMFQYSNAGHSSIILYKKKYNKIFELEKAVDIPLGIQKDTKYKVANFLFEKDDVILLETDGVYEAKNNNNELFTIERVKSSLLKYKDNDAKEINKFLLSEIKKFIGNNTQTDDITLITIKKVG